MAANCTDFRIDARAVATPLRAPRLTFDTPIAEPCESHKPARHISDDRPRPLVGGARTVLTWLLTTTRWQVVLVGVLGYWFLALRRYAAIGQ